MGVVSANMHPPLQLHVARASDIPRRLSISGAQIRLGVAAQNGAREITHDGLRGPQRWPSISWGFEESWEVSTPNGGLTCGSKRTVRLLDTPLRALVPQSLVPNQAEYSSNLRAVIG